MQLVELLLRHGADPNADCKDEWAPLNKAADCGHLDIVEIQVAQGGSLSEVSAKGLTALNRASVRGHIKMNRYLLSRHSDVDAKMLSAWAPLHGAASSDRTEVVQLLSRYKTNINHVAEDGCTALHRACLGGHLDTISTLLRFGADCLIADDLSENPLHKASRGGCATTFYLSLGD